MTAQLQVSDFTSWLRKPDKPLLIAGPCSAEGEGQLLETAKRLTQEIKPDVLRAGIWKPRTRPNAFEGVGKEGLKWLKEAGRRNEIPVITEVANAAHVELALEAEIDMLWIGARTTVNPFFVQEIANALRGVDIPVFVKNPVNPDIDLWVGALERLNGVGVDKLVAVHRGFSSFGSSVYRNVPMWEIPIELKAKYPEVEVICDPSHIAGSSELIGVVSQRALDLDFAGLMIETHLNPAEALSDKDQQLTPEQLKAVWGNLQPRKATSGNVKFQNQLEYLRDQIDQIDDALLKKLAERMAIVQQIGKYKKENNVTVLQIERWKEILKSRGQWGDHLNLKNELVQNLLELIHTESIRVQTGIMDEGE